MRPFQRLAAALVLAAALPSAARGEVALNGNNYLFNCPFYKANDSYDFQGVINSVKESLQDKLTKREDCRAALNQFLNGLDTSQKMFTNLSVEEQKQIMTDMYRRYESELNAQIADLRVQYDNTTDPLLQSQILSQQATYWSALQASQSSRVAAEIEFGNQQASLEESRRRQFYTALNGALTTLNTMPSECKEIAGGSGALIPAFLQISSMATGFTGFASSSIVEPVIKLVGNLATLLIDHNVRRAFNRVQKFQNDQIVACTYYALKYSACEYKQALRIADDTPRIEQLIQGKIAKDKYADFFALDLFKSRAKEIYAGVFDKTASAGTTLALESSNIIELVSAMKIDPNTLPAAPAVTFPKFTNAEREAVLAWIDVLETRGIGVSSRNPLTGGPAAIEDRYDIAIAEIARIRDTLAALNSKFLKNLSFEDLRGELDRAYPELYDRVGEDLAFLRALADPANPRLESKRKNSLLVAIEVLDKLHDFLAVDANALVCGAVPRVACYSAEITLKGKEMFDSFTRGNVAQISNQNIVFIASTAKQRMERAADIVDKLFVGEDVARKALADKYAYFQTLKGSYGDILKNLAQYTTRGKVMRREGYDGTMESFEQGFGREIVRMLERARDRDTRLFGDMPEMLDATFPHLCSLFASSLPHIRGGERMLRECQKSAKTLDQIVLADPSLKPIPIDYGDACFYHRYNKLLDMQTLILNARRFVK